MRASLRLSCVELQARCLRNPEPVPVDHQEQDVVADAVPSLLGRLQQALHFGVGEEVFGPNVGIDSPTLSISALGRHCEALRECPSILGAIDRDLVHSMLRVALVPAEPLCSEPTDAEPPR